MDKRFVKKIEDAKWGELTNYEILLSFKLATMNPSTLDDFKLIIKLAKHVEKLIADEEPKPKSKSKSKNKTDK